MNVSRGLFEGSNFVVYIVVSWETVVRSGTDLTCGIVDECAPDVHSASGGAGLVRPALDGAALGPSLWLDSKLVLDLEWVSA